MRKLAFCLVFMTQMTLPSVSQQAASNVKSAVSCTFDDGKQMTVRYSSAPANGRQEFHQGKLWELDGSPMLLFTQTAMTLGNTEIPAGAFSLYVIPQKHEWTLVVNRNVTEGSKYDEKDDLVRAPMQIGETESPLKQPEVAFGLVGPKQCNMRVYYKSAGAWAEFREK